MRQLRLPTEDLLQSRILVEKARPYLDEKLQHILATRIPELVEVLLSQLAEGPTAEEFARQLKVFMDAEIVAVRIRFGDGRSERNSCYSRAGMPWVTSQDPVSLPPWMMPYAGVLSESLPRAEWGATLGTEGAMAGPPGWSRRRELRRAGVPRN